MSNSNRQIIKIIQPAVIVIGIIMFFYCFSRGLAAGVYTTNSPEACQYVLENCKANIVVVENDKQLQKILQVSRVYVHVHV